MADDLHQGGKRKSFTGRARRHRNRWAVRFADAAARWVITVGGIGTIVAVLLVFVFLLSVALPLFWPRAQLSLEGTTTVELSEPPMAFAVNEYRTLAWSLRKDGQLSVLRTDTGEILGQRALIEEGTIRSVSYQDATGIIVLGMDDGTVSLGTIRFSTSFREPREFSQSIRDAVMKAPQSFEEGIVESTPQGQYRFQTVDTEIFLAIPLASTAVVRLDALGGGSSESGGGDGPTIAAVAADGSTHFVTTRFNEITSQYKLDEKRVLERPTAVPSGPPMAIHLAGRGDTIHSVWPDGTLATHDARDLDAIVLVETLDVLDADDREITASNMTLGRETLVFGDSRGGLSAWFPVRRLKAVPGESNSSGAVESSVATNPEVSSAGTGATADETREITRLERTHVLPAGPAAVTSLSPSQRSRLMSAGFANGQIGVYHITTEQQLVLSSTNEPVAASFVQLAPKDDALIALKERRIERFAFDPKHPEGSFAALFRPVWYEGYDEPSHVWQSSFAGVEPEMKLGLWPLIFGTLKATFYSMAFGVPVALLAAIYTSEFMAPRTKAKIKPMIEMMASLPSVVLGFLAALVFAPIVETSLPEILSSMVMVPLAIVIGAALWQILPSSWVPYMAPWRLPLIIVTSALGLWLGIGLGDLVERYMFAGNILRWLDGQVGSGTAGWLFLSIPFSALLVTVACVLVVNPWLRQNLGDWPRVSFGMLNAAKIACSIVVTFVLAWLLAATLNAIGWDPRGSFVATYVQRNALIVGFVMGFAIIPIIYTIADDALSTVPQHLRSASLGAGATQWQTAVRVVIPTAMSGLFSAVMIGLGRAVGETMIVLMAGGNTPVTDWNLFNGFRTLSANIAVELPEAVRDSTHFRTLFLAALTLFFLTFVVNTAAELVRSRFRRRALQL